VIERKHTACEKPVSVGSAGGWSRVFIPSWLTRGGRGLLLREGSLKGSGEGENEHDICYIIRRRTLGTGGKAVKKVEGHFNGVERE